MKDQTKKQKKLEDKMVDQLLTLNEDEIRTFRGNPLLKRAGEKVEMTKEHIREYKRCMEDPVYFAENYIKVVHVDRGLVPIELYDYQKKLLRAFQENRYNIVLSCRQSGKCVTGSTNVTVRNAKMYGEDVSFTMTMFDLYWSTRLKQNSLIAIYDEKFRDKAKLGDGWEVLTDTGWQPVYQIFRTIHYTVWTVTTENHTLRCADEHILFTEELAEVYVKDLTVGDVVMTESGPEAIVSIEEGDTAETMFDLEVYDDNHRYYTDGFLSHNTTTTVCFFLWYVLFHADKACAILANKGATARQIVGRIELAYINLPKWLQQGVCDWNKGSFGLENGSYVTSAATSSDSVRGSSFSMCMVDEVAFCQHWEPFWQSTFPTISSGSETKVILVSTFNGQNHFYEMWEDAINGRSDFHPTRVDWWDVPGRDEAWHQFQLRNMSEEDFAQEYGNEPLGSGFTLINSKGFTLLAESRQDPIQFTLNTKIYELPEPNHKYMLTCDCADTGVDYSTISVIDITQFPYKQVATYRNNTISHLMFPHAIIQLATKYNNAAVLVESNDVGKVILHILNYDMEYDNIVSTRNGMKTQLGQRTTAKSKTVGCARLKDMIESKQLLIRDKATIEEFKHFIVHGPSYAADDGFHDDMVMGLVVFAYFASTPRFRIEYDKNFIDEMNPTYEMEMMEALTPLPMFNGTRREDPLDGLPPGFLD